MFDGGLLQPLTSGNSSSMLREEVISLCACLPQPWTLPKPMTFNSLVRSSNQFFSLFSLCYQYVLFLRLVKYFSDDITGARRLYNGSSQELLLRRKLMEQQQQAAELQRAIELQGSRFMNLQLNLNKSGLSNSPAIAVTQSLSDVDRSSNTSSSSSSSHEGSPTEGMLTYHDHFLVVLLKIELMA